MVFVLGHGFQRFVGESVIDRNETFRRMRSMSCPRGVMPAWDEASPNPGADPTGKHRGGRSARQAGFPLLGSTTPAGPRVPDRRLEAVRARRRAPERNSSAHESPLVPNLSLKYRDIASFDLAADLIIPPWRPASPLRSRPRSHRAAAPRAPSLPRERFPSPPPRHAPRHCLAAP